MKINYCYQVIVAVGLVCGSPLLGDEILKLKDLKEKGGVIEVKLDDADSVQKGDKICFYNADQKKVGCSKVGKITAQGTALAKVTAKTFPKLEVGMTAKMEPKDPSQTEKEAADVEKSADGSSTGGSSNQGKPHFTVRGLYAPFLMSPVVYNSVTYNAPSSSEIGNKLTRDLWSADKKNTANLYFISLSSEIPVGKTGALDLGLRYGLTPASTVDADYLSGVLNPYIELKQSFTDIGLWCDYVWKTIPIFSKSSIFFASGLDIENTAVTFTATEKSDTDSTVNQEVGSLKSKMTALSLRMRTGFDFIFAGPFGVHTGLTLMLPFAKVGATSSSAANDSNSANNSATADNLKASINHSLGKFGVGFDLGASLAF